jgi:formylglycine-generating enzyme required for sulfatase activity
VKIAEMIEEAISHPAIPVQDTSLEYAPQGRETTRSGVRESSALPTSSATLERPPAHPAGPMPQTPPRRASTGMPSEVQPQLERMRSSDLNAQERVAAGDGLAQPGDPRFRADARYLPDEPLLGFVEIPAGPFLMGRDKAHDPEAYADELARHEVTLPRYFISRYPVTVVQFQVFVEGAGSRPENPRSLRGIANHPVVSVKWYKTLQYCDWLTERLRV